MKTPRTAPVPARTPLPAALPPLPELELAARYQATRTGGDFFDAVVLDHCITLMLTDIAGVRAQAHPVAAALQDVFRSCSHSIFSNDYSNESEGTAALLHEINRALLGRALLGHAGGICFAPTFLGCYNRKLAILTYINAGGVSPLFRDSDGTRPLDTGGVPLGVFSHLTHEPAMQAFEPGARMLLMTKGLIHGSHGSSTRQRDAALARIRTTFEDPALLSAREMCAEILKTSATIHRPRFLASLRKSEAPEDQTVVALMRPGPSQRTS